MGSKFYRLTIVLFVSSLVAFQLLSQVDADAAEERVTMDSAKADAASTDSSVSGKNRASLNKRLLDAAAKGDAAEIRKSLKAGADIECRDGNLGATPLAWAAFLGQTRAVKQLLAKGADVNAPNKKKWTPLMLACAKKHLKAARALLKKGADIDALSVEGWTALSIAFSKKDPKLVSLLSSYCSKSPWAETLVTKPGPKSRCAAVRSGPFGDARKLSCLKPGKKLKLTGIWTKSGWAQMSHPRRGWILGIQIDMKKLPPRKRVVLDVRKPQRAPQQRRRSPQSRRPSPVPEDDGFIDDPDLYPRLPERKKIWH